MITIVSFLAFNKVNREVFIKGESFEQINETLYSICSTYQVTEILQGVMQNLPLQTLEKIQTNTKKFKLTIDEACILIEALDDFKHKVSSIKEIVTVGNDNCSALLEKFEAKAELASLMQQQLKKD